MEKHRKRPIKGGVTLFVASYRANIQTTIISLFLATYISSLFYYLLPLIPTMAPVTRKLSTVSSISSRSTVSFKTTSSCSASSTSSGASADLEARLANAKTISEKLDIIFDREIQSLEVRLEIIKIKVKLNQLPRFLSKKLLDDFEADHKKLLNKMEAFVKNSFCAWFVHFL